MVPQNDALFSVRVPCCKQIHMMWNFHPFHSSMRNGGGQHKRHVENISNVSHHLPMPKDVQPTAKCTDDTYSHISYEKETSFWSQGNRFGICQKNTPQIFRPKHTKTH